MRCVLEPANEQIFPHKKITGFFIFLNLLYYYRRKSERHAGLSSNPNYYSVYKTIHQSLQKLTPLRSCFLPITILNQSL
jgi:hypothetical protein